MHPTLLATANREMGLCGRSGEDAEESGKGKEAFISAPFRLMLVKLCCHISCSIIVFAYILHKIMSSSRAGPESH